jgi:hypothetical protein
MTLPQAAEKLPGSCHADFGAGWAANDPAGGRIVG